MGDMAEYFTIYAEIHKEKREKRRAKYEPLLEDLGAICKSNGVYMLGYWFLYPTKGFAMNKYNYEKKKIRSYYKGNGKCQEREKLLRKIIMMLEVH